MSALVLGNDEDFVGMSTVGRAAPRGKKTQAMPSWAKNGSNQGVSVPDEEMDYLPFEEVTLTGSTALTGVLVGEPQRPFRGERLILQIVDLDDGSDVSYLGRISPAIYVGAVQIGAAQGSMPFTSFAANAFGVRMTWPQAGQGTKVKVFFTVAVNASTAGLLITAGNIGRAVR